MLFLGLYVFSQEYYIPQDSSNHAKHKNKTSFLNKDNIHTSISLGSSIGSNNYFSSYIAPNIQQQYSDRLSINYGAVLSMNSGNNLFYDGYSNSVFISPNSTKSFYVDGAYRLSNKMQIHSKVLLQTNNYNSQGFNENINSNYMQIGLEYNFSNNFKIQAEIGMGNGMHPYRNMVNPYANDFGISPFYNSLFGY